MSENIDSVIPENEDVKETKLVEEKVADVVPEPVQEVVTLPEPEVEEQPHLAPVADGVIGSTTKKVTKTKETPAPAPAEKKKATIDKDSVAIYSSRSVFWEGVGKVIAGYNIVTKKQADQWLTRKHVRPVTPEELAKEFTV